ncbi:MAG: hypothetical protein K5774_01260 [Clostridia bacterium]|nr:hypothetical protein [Clostridia bacterium]
MTTGTTKKISFAEAALILAATVAIMFIGIIVLGLDPHIPLLVDLAFIMCVGRVKGVSWGDMTSATMDFLGKNISAVGVIMLIGVVVGSFMTCGAVPFTIYYGLKLMSVRWFFVCTILICFVMALLTGSSFTSVSTIGVAFMGVGLSLGIPPAMVAGAIITAALAGDKHSPLSAVANLSASLCGVSVYDTEKCTRYTTLPTVIGSAVIFTILGMKYSSAEADTSQVEQIIAGLEAHYDLSFFVVLPLLLLLALVILKVPAFPALIFSSVAGVAVSVVFQHETLIDCLKYMQTGYETETGIDLLDRLLSRGGLFSMTSVVIIIILGLSLAGGMSRLSIMEILMDKIGPLMKSRFSVVTGAFLMSFLLVLISSDTYMAMVLTVNSMKKCFERVGIHPVVLSRCLVDGGCALCGIVPWCVACIFFSETLGVPVSGFFPYYFLGFGTVLFTLLSAATGIGVKYAEKAE